MTEPPRAAIDLPGARGGAGATSVGIDVARVSADGLLRVEGWATGPVPIVAVQMFLGHCFLGLAELGVPRGDVGLAFPADPCAAWSGFRFIGDVTSEDLRGQTVHARIMLLGDAVLRASVAPDIAELGHPPRVPAQGIEALQEHCVQLPDRAWAISGWALSPSGIREVAVSLDGAAAARAEIGLSRPDIGNRFPRLPGARHSGFAFRGLLPLAAAPPRSVSVRISALDGEERLLSWPLLTDPVASAGSGPRGVSRDTANRIKFFIEAPLLVDGVTPWRLTSPLLVRGWAVARDHVESVHVTFDGRAVGRAHFGLHRPDIGASFQDWPERDRCGFALGIDPVLLTSGEHAVRVVVRDKAGAEAATTFGVRVPAGSEPIATTVLRTRMSQAEIDLDQEILKTTGPAPHFAVIMLLAGTGAAEIRRARQTLTALRNQVYHNWHLLVLLPSGWSTASARTVSGWFDDLAPRISIRAAESARPITDDGRASHLMVLRAGDLLGCDALMEFAVEASVARGAELLYADERRYDPTQRAIVADFRPQWSPNLLLSCNYIGRTWCTTSLLAESSCITEDDLHRFGTYDLLLRLTEHAAVIHHIPKILCETARAGDGVARLRAALRRALRRRRIAGEVTAGLAPGLFRIHHGTPADDLVSIIVPTCGSRDLFRTAIASIRATTSRACVQLVVIDNIPADRHEDKAWLRAQADIVVPMPGPFNWSRFNNCGAAVATGKFLVFLNDDVEMQDAAWLGALVEQTQRPEIGVVGGRLLYPEGLLQHAGISLSPTRGLHPFRFMPKTYPGPFGCALAVRDVSAVTGACMAVRKEVFERLGGFDEAHAIINNDLDFCLRARSAGLSVVVTPYAELIHHELASRALLGEDHDAARFRTVCGPALSRGDAFLNPNLSRFSEQMAPEPEPTRVMVAGHPLLASGNVQRILAVKLDHIGDFVTAFPAFRRLRQRFPAASLHVMCSPAAAKFARLEPAIDAVIAFDVFHAKSSRGRRRLAAGDLERLRVQLGGGRYDIAIDLRKHPETRSILRMSGARLLAGFDRNHAFPWLDVALEWAGDPPLRAKRSHITDDLLALVEAVAVACEPDRAAAAHPNRDTLRPAAAVRTDDRVRICIHPTAGNPMKQWPAEHFATLMDLLAETEDAEFILIGGSGDQPITTRLLEQMRQRHRVRSMVGKVGLEALPGLLLQCDLFVGNDSGPKHLAAMLGVPTVGLHSGVVDPVEWGPLGARGVAVYRQMACSPCYKTKLSMCGRGLACLRQLLPADVAPVCRRLAVSATTRFATHSSAGRPPPPHRNWNVSRGLGIAAAGEDGDGTAEQR